MMCRVMHAAHVCQILVVGRHCMQQLEPVLLLRLYCSVYKVCNAAAEWPHLTNMKLACTQPMQQLGIHLTALLA
jgi:hypothetical protein